MRPRRRLNPAFSPAFSGKLWTWQPVKLCFACWGYSITWYDKVKVKLNLMILDYDCPICKIPPSPPLKSGESWPLPFAKVGNLGLPLLKRGIEGDFHPPVYLGFYGAVYYSISLYKPANRLNGGGGSRIRTHGTSRHNGFQDRLLKPLGHPSNLYILQSYNNNNSWTNSQKFCDKKQWINLWSQFRNISVRV